METKIITSKWFCYTCMSLVATICDTAHELVGC